MKKTHLVLLLSIIYFNPVFSQVGIGTSNPNPKSILDLSNSSEHFLVLPATNMLPTPISLDTSASLIYYQGNIYFKAEASKIKTLNSPFIWDGDTTHSISSPVTAPVGIGVVPAPLSPYRFIVADAAGDIISGLSGNASIVIGNPAATHLLIDNNELMVKSNPTTAGTLILNEENGTIETRSLASDAGIASVFTSYGSMDAKGKMKENGNDLLPVGSITMWSGGTLPGGWALCNGGTYTTMDGGSITTPDLKDRFIVAAGASYALGNTGGLDSVRLTTNELPIHNHTGSTNSAGAHTHNTDVPNSGEGYVLVFNSSNEVYKWNRTGAITSTSAGSHSHTFTTSNRGLNWRHDNKPPFYTLAYIMKL